MMCVNHSSDVIPVPELLDELQHLGSLPFDWIEIVEEDPTHFRCQQNVVRLPRLCQMLVDTSTRNASEMSGLLSASKWLQGGPKIVRPTEEQAEALGQVEINLGLKDYAQPFPAVLVETPCPPFYGVICHLHKPTVLILSALSYYNTDDVMCLIRQQEDRLIESYLNRVDEDVKPLMRPLLKAQRLALNMCLALVNFGCTSGPLLPKQHAEDVRLAKRDDESGAKAKRRVREAVHKVEFAQPVIIRRAASKSEDSVPTGRTTRQHWVRGHWKMQPCGAGLKERKRILIAPYLTHAEQTGFPGPVAYVDKR